MIDSSVVFCKGSGQRGQMLNPSCDTVVIDGGTAGASVLVGQTPGAGVLTATVASDGTTGAWSAVAVGATQAVAASTRRAFRQADGNAVPLSWTFT